MKLGDCRLGPDLKLAALHLWDLTWGGIDVIQDLEMISSRILSSKLHSMSLALGIAVMVNISDVRSRKAGNGLKISKQLLPVWFSHLGIHVKKKAAVSLFLGTAVNK